MTTEKQIHYVRPSTVGSYGLCPARTQLRDSEGFNHYPNEALLFGTVVHWMIEQTLIGKDFTKARAMLELEPLFRKDTPVSDPEVAMSITSITTLSQRSQLVEEALQAHELWVTNVQKRLPEKGQVVEERLDMHLEFYHDFEIRLRGTSDLLYPEHEIGVDWKTAGTGWNADKALSQIGHIAYPLLARVDREWEIKKFSYWVYDRKAKSWKEHRVSSGNGRAEEAFFQSAYHVGVSQLTDLRFYRPTGTGFKARGWHCSPKYCDAWGACSGKYLVDDGLASQRALTTKQRWKP